ncbi:Protein-tyrosine-phosphatase [Hahella chejuensis KCTC 2396]|uniref:Protein-tyrosine-phosphatase n=1 Tax=Hahella chejuensis (strain KCTC 2396) TaxID=349521 RepID=Q2SPK8_HAHCH|nr:arsenate reductase ArsC [Hahella chejuensis]ABC27416.1 Protein-tyrosine-phosphatase [Hahella chejuensis KCTC 2396]
MKLLFLCTHNACRSILAESLARQIGAGLWSVASAGSSPAGRIHPDTLAALTERGLPTEGLHSKSWNEVKDFHPDVVITVCDQAAGESCPVWFGQAAKLHWGLPDPSKQTDPQSKRHQFEQVINMLETKLLLLVKVSRQQPSTPKAQWQAELERLEEEE